MRGDGLSKPLIACRNVWKIFGPTPRQILRTHNGAPSPDDLKATGHIAAVRDVSLDVGVGEILVVMGLSGSGKSTLIRCLARLIEPTSGEIMVEGKNLLAASRRDLIELRRHKMGMVFQHFALLPHRTVLHNVAFPLEMQGIGRSAREMRAREMISLVGLEGREGYYPRELSGGQQQRVGIARSLAVGPDIWFLDEPFSALDPLIRREMQDEFLRLQAMLQKSIVFITHDFDEAIRLADRIAIMFEGEVVQIGTPAELVTNPATAYVREFTKEVARDKVLTVADAMVAANGNGVAGEGPPLSASAKLSAVAPQVLQSSTAFGVVDDEGRPVGAISRDQVIAAMFAPDQVSDSAPGEPAS